jgi:hypothetical protein
VDPGGNRAILNMGEGGTWPAKEEGIGTVGIGRRRRLDTFKMLEGSMEGSSAHYKTSLMHRVRIICVMCVFNLSYSR